MFKTIGDLNVHYDVQGTGYPMVLLHGGGSRAQTFEEMVPILAKSFQVYTFDMRGFGDTQRPAQPRLSHELWRDDLLPVPRHLRPREGGAGRLVSSAVESHSTSSSTIPSA